jgi:hypothetical protein
MQWNLIGKINWKETQFFFKAWGQSGAFGKSFIAPALKLYNIISINSNQTLIKSGHYKR